MSHHPYPPYHASRRPAAICRLAIGFLVWVSSAAIASAAETELNRPYPYGQATTSQAAPAESQLANEMARRLAETTRELCSPEANGRGLNSPGLEYAANVVARKMAEAGLRLDLANGSPFQTFETAVRSELGRENQLEVVLPTASPGGKPARLPWKFRDDFLPMAMSGPGPFDLPLAFAGYGITALEAGFDDYAGLDVRGKAVIVLRHVPPVPDLQPRSDTREPHPSALFRTKVLNARQHGAAAIIFCTDQKDVDRQLAQCQRELQTAQAHLAAEQAKAQRQAPPSAQAAVAQRQRLEQLARQVEQAEQRLREERDPMLPFSSVLNDDSGGGIPVLQCRRAVVDAIVHGALQTRLADLEQAIDQRLSPQSRDLPGWRIAGRVDVFHAKAQAKNVIGAIEPAPGPLAEETIVVGAHYDHLGGADPKTGSNSYFAGADDNASGVAVILETARQLNQRRGALPRRVLFVAFSGEERGLLGSQHYVSQPVVPLEKTVAMINLDMVGRMVDRRLIVMGTGTSAQFGPMLSDVNRYFALEILRQPEAAAASDHLSFAERGLPVLFFHTGLHADYHRPTDTPEKLNVAGMQQITMFVSAIVEQIAASPGRPEIAGRLKGVTLTSGFVPSERRITTTTPAVDGAPVTSRMILTNPRLSPAAANR